MSEEKKKYRLLGVGRVAELKEATIIPVHGKLQEAVLDLLKNEFDHKQGLWFVEDKRDYFALYSMVIPQGLMVNLSQQAVISCLDLEERIHNWKEDSE